MLGEIVKTSAITYGGYRYQSLFGTHVLAQWLDAPSRYLKLKFEADDSEIAPRGLDDIVAVREDGKHDYWQVKYTPPESVHPYYLDWGWLLTRDARKPKSKSLLRKWSDALAKIEASKLGDVWLITNREPDDELARCLEGNRLDYDLVPPHVKRLLDAELNGEAAARRLLSILQIRHSEHSFLNLEEAVRARLLRVGADEDGIARLRNKTEDWSLFRGHPAPDGWITLDAIRAVLSPARPIPIPEDFVVPAGYTVPDASFHENLLRKASAPTTSVITVTGPPGRGKSTYLSHLCDALSKSSIPYIRHHYFLSLQDRTFNRISPFTVATALLAQIARNHAEAGASGDGPEHLGRAVQRCGIYYQEYGKPFVVVLDGLDHVWRENQDDISPLAEILGQLLPAERNVIVILGTQPVNDARLPPILLSQSPRSDWQELPPMSVTAVHDYVMQQVHAKRWILSDNEGPDQTETLVRALHNKTGGHPLHVIYSVEALLAETQHPSAWQIDELPACPGSDIREYYRLLWHRLSPPQQDALHLICEFPFRWPRTAFREMRPTKSSGALSLNGVEHLLHDNSGGVSPFHDSLVVFICEQQGHLTSVSAWLKSLSIWLEEEANPHLRNCWLWRVRAKLGDDRPLRHGITRDWCLDRLVDGYRIAQIESMLVDAERAAFDNGDFADAYRHRTLKTRLYNGPQFQIEDVGDVSMCSWQLSGEQEAVDDIWHARSELTVEDAARLTLALVARGENERALHLARELRHRHLEEARMRHRALSARWVERHNLVARAMVATNLFDFDKAAASGKLDNYPPEWLHTVADSLESRCDISALLTIHSSLLEPENRAIFEQSAARSCCFSGAQLVSWSESQRFNSSSWAALYLKMAGSPEPHIPWTPVWRIDKSTYDYYERRQQLRETVREWFLKSAVTALCASGAFSWLYPPDFAEIPGFSELLNTLTAAAESITSHWRSGNSVPVYAVLHQCASMEISSSAGSYHRSREDIERALLTVSFDVHALSTLRGGPRHTDSAAIAKAREATWFSHDVMPEVLLTIPHAIVSRGVCVAMLEELETKLLTDLQETSEIVRLLLELTQVAVAYGLSSHAKKLCRLTWDMILGYMHRKDPELDDVVTAIEYLAEVAPTDALAQLRASAPAITHVERFTDGKGTRHVPDVASRLLSRLDRQRLATKYEEDVEAGRWSHAEVALRHYLDSAADADEMLLAIARTGLLEPELPPCNGSLATSIHQEAAGYLGRQMFASSTKEEGAHDGSDGSTDDSGFVIDFEDFPPSRASDFLAALRTGNASSYRLAPQWYEFWEKRGMGSALLRFARPLAMSAEARRTDAIYFLDSLLETSLRLLGSTDMSFDLAVEAHVQMNGWTSWEGNERTEARLALVAAHFGSRANDFVRQSARSWIPSVDRGLVIPGDKLVYFLARLGRASEAVALTEAIVSSVVESTRNLRVTRPRWAA